MPSITKFALEDLKDVGSLDMAKVERKNDPEFTKRYQAAEMMLEQAGDECGVDVSLCGPFTAAASIYPTEKLLMALRKDPEGVHRLLRFCTDCIKMICRDFWTLGTGFTLCDPVASGTILRKQDYMDFVFPYTCEIVKDLHDIGASAGYHICGNTTKIVEPMVDTGIDMLSLDGQVDMALAKEKVGERVCIVGNVDPIDVMLNGTFDDVDAAVRRCFVQAQDSPSGFILATGCDIPNMAPVENVFRFMEAARKYGRAAAKGEPLPA